MTQQLTQNLFQYWKVPRSKCKWKICSNRGYFIMLYLCMPLTLALQIANTMNVSDRKTLSSIFERNEINGETERKKKNLFICTQSHTSFIWLNGNILCRPGKRVSGRTFYCGTDWTFLWKWNAASGDIKTSGFEDLSSEKFSPSYL